jgi:hypothetical protein
MRPISHRYLFPWESNPTQLSGCDILFFRVFSRIVLLIVSQGYPDMFEYGRRGFEFMRPLVNDMVQDDPTKRPTSDEVVARFADIRKGLSSWKLRSRVIGKREFSLLPHRIVGHWYRRIRSITMGVPAVPVPSS